MTRALASPPPFPNSTPPIQAEEFAGVGVTSKIKVTKLLRLLTAWHKQGPGAAPPAAKTPPGDSREERHAPKEQGVKQNNTHLEEGAAGLVVGAKVEARWRGTARYYPGRIAFAHGNGTYDIHYDDDGKETGVRGELIRLHLAAGGGGGVDGSGGGGGGGGTDAANAANATTQPPLDIDSAGIKALKALISDAGLTSADCFEKSELRARAREAQELLSAKVGSAAGGGGGARARRAAYPLLGERVTIRGTNRSSLNGSAGVAIDDDDAGHYLVRLDRQPAGPNVPVPRVNITTESDPLRVVIDAMNLATIRDDFGSKAGDKFASASA